MKVLLLGGSGFSGSTVLEELLKRGHQVTALSRSHHKITQTSRNLKVLVGDMKDAQFLESALQGQEAVINCLGIGGKGSGKVNSAVSDATKVLVDVMGQSDVKKLFCMSNVGAGDSMKQQLWFFRKIVLPYFMKWLKAIIDDKNKMESYVIDSKLDWSIFRFPNITTRDAKNTITTSLDNKKLRMSITRADLAKFMVDQLNNDTYLRQTLSVSN